MSNMNYNLQAYKQIIDNLKKEIGTREKKTLSLHQDALNSSKLIEDL